MSTEAIQLAAALRSAAAGASDSSPLTAPGALGPARAADGRFGRMVAGAIGSVNEQLLVSQRDLQQLATGDVQNLHQIMIRLEESRLSLQLLLQVRNRLLEAYQDVMKMQV